MQKDMNRIWIKRLNDLLSHLDRRIHEIEINFIQLFF